MCVAGALYLAGVLKFRVATPLDLLLTSLLTMGALAFTIGSYWHTHVRGAGASRTFLYLQALFDVALVTTVVHITGGPESDFAGLYVVVVALTALLMPPTSTALVTALVALAYLADVFLGHQVVVGTALWSQVGIFVLVAVVTAYVASRVSVVDAEREALVGELRQVRLEAGDVLRNLRSGVLTVDGDGVLLYCNPAAEELLGFQASAWVGRPILPELARLAPDFWAAIAATARRRVRQLRVEAEVRRPDRTFPIGVTTTTLEAPGSLGADAQPRVTAIFSDISDSKRLEELRLRTGRLEAVAELSASLAHEIKNPLASIRSSVEQLARGAHTNPDEKFLTGLVVRESDRLSRLLTEFIDFSRVRVTQRRPVDLAQVAAGAVRLVREHPDCAGDADIRVEGGPVRMEGDEDLLHRIVWNLVLNAVQAAGSGARVTVRISRPAPEALPMSVPLEAPVSLAVSDNGPGVPDPLRGRLFQPFVSGRTGGSGLGLAIVQRAVEAHGGVVLVDSTAGRGSTFTAYFPGGQQKEEAA